MKAADKQPIALLTAGTGRPKTIAYRGGIIYIEAHDEWYSKIVNAFRRDIMAYHPETREQFAHLRKNKSPEAPVILKQIIERYKSFMRAESNWYEAFGLKPPTVKRMIDKNRKLFYTRGDGTDAYKPPNMRSYDKLGLKDSNYVFIHAKANEKTVDYSAAGRRHRNLVCCIECKRELMRIGLYSHLGRHSREAEEALLLKQQTEERIRQERHERRKWKQREWTAAFRARQRAKAAVGGD